ncbi:hypothetical protein IJI76_00045 [Candidatus Saccharibacteria bacterium]|nr:hypothetical protein [Candidatus Saccharibacteria bacterium]
MKEFLAVPKDEFCVEDYNRWFDEAKDDFEDRIKHSGPEERLELIAKIDELIYELEQADKRITDYRDSMTYRQPGRFIATVVFYSVILLIIPTITMSVMLVYGCDTSETLLVSYVVIPVILFFLLSQEEGYQRNRDVDVLEEIALVTDSVKDFLRFRIIKKTDKYQKVMESKKTTVKFIHKLKKVKRKLLLAR